jgi:hypothetical protein
MANGPNANEDFQIRSIITALTAETSSLAMAMGMGFKKA